MKSITAVLLSSVIAALIAGCGGAADTEPDTGPVDRQYRLEALMIGYIGQGGEIDGEKNPVLRARQGESVEIVIVNGERMVHDIAFRRHRVRSDTILEHGATTSITFIAETDDTYYCTIPGHLEAGMAGEFRLIEGPSDPAEAGSGPG